MQNQSADLETARIIIVVDEIKLPEELASSLKSLGYEIIGRASSAQEAIRLVEEYKPDLVLIDLMLQGEDDGIETAERLRTRFDIAVIYLTGFVDGDLLDRANSTAPSGYLGKGATLMELRTTIELALKRHDADRRLRESERRYRAIIEDQIEPICRFLPNFTLTFVNGAYCRYFRKQAHDLIGQSFLEVIPDSYHEEVCKHFASFSTKHAVSTQQHEVIGPDGKLHWMEWKTRALYDDQDRLMEFQSVGRDVTERKRAREALRESEELFRAIFEQAAVGVAQIVSRTGKFVRINQRYCDIVGRTREEMERRSFQEITHPEDLQEDLNNMKLILEGKIREFSMEKRYYHKDGHVVWVNLTVSPMWKVGEEPGFHIAVVEDITARKKAEDLQRASEEHLRLITDNLPALISYVSADRRYVFVNREYEKAHGLKREEIVGRYVKDVLGESGYGVARKHINAVLSGEQVAYEQSFMLEGRQRWLRVNYVPDVDDRGLVRGFFALVTDLTDHKEAEEALRASEARYRHLFESTGLFISQYDRQGKCLMMNPTVARHFGGERGDFERKTFIDLHSEAAEEYARRVKEVIETGETREYEDLVEFPTGPRWLYSEVRPVPIPGSAAEAAQILSIDITARKQAEEALEESEEKFRRLFDLSSDAHVLYDKDGVLDANDACVNMLGLSKREDIATARPEDFSPEFQPDGQPSAEKMKRMVQMALEKGSHRFEWLLQMVDGAHLYTDIQLTRIMLKGKAVIHAVLRDITDRKMDEVKIRASLKEKEILLSEIHHRVKNNLALVSSLLRLQSKSAKDEYHRKMFEDAQDRIRSMALVHERLYHSENLAEVDMREYVASLVDHFALPEKWIGSLIEINKDVEALQMSLDKAVPLGFLINELVSNALKHAHPNFERGTINISLRTVGQGNVKLIVKDDGVGIPESVNVETPQSFGLNLIKLFTRQLSGTTELIKDGGTEFRITFRAT